jgi:hypothetical protein
VRRAALATAGLVMVAGTLGFFGTSGAWGAVPAAPHINNGSTWTIEVNPKTCEVGTFSSNGTFSFPASGDSGTWTGGGTSVKVKWTGGADVGLKFKGAWSTTPVKEYAGTFGGPGSGDTGQLVKGSVGSFGGTVCPPPPSGLTWNSPAKATAGGPLAVSSIDPCPSTLPNGSPVNGTVYAGIFVTQGSGGWGDATRVNANGSWSATYTLGAPSGSWTIKATCTVEQTGETIAVYAPHAIVIN